MAELKVITMGGITYKQVQKRTARRLYIAGTKVFCVGNNANPYYMGFGGFSEIKEDFEKFLNEFLYYLPAELGKYAHFYIICE